MNEKEEKTECGKIAITLMAGYDYFFKVLREAGYDIEIFVVPTKASMYEEEDIIEEACDIPKEEEATCSTKKKKGAPVPTEFTPEEKKSGKIK